MTLNDMYDVTVDYGGEGAAGLGEAQDAVTVRTELIDASRVGNYAVSTMAWSPQHSELMLASYSKVSKSHACVICVCMCAQLWFQLVILCVTKCR
jgi:hypothetical protein